MYRGEKHLWMIVLALAALVVLLAPDSQAADRKLVVQMDEPYEVSGTLYPPSELSVRRLGHHTPVTSLNEIRVDGQILGVVVGRRAEANAAAPDDSLIFRRALSGHLVLHSIALVGELPHELNQASLQSDGDPTDLLQSNQPRVPEAAR